jgi:hypothetical protein
MTTQEWKDQLREFRSALAAQLSQPMHFAGEPFTGATMGPLIALVAAALNKGEAVLPQSTYTSMLRADVEKLCRRLESQVKDVVYQNLKNVELSAQGFISNKKAALSTYDETINSLKLDFDYSINLMIGKVRGEMYKQVVSDSPQLVESALLSNREHFLASYQNLFSAWCRKKRNEVELYITDQTVSLIEVTKVFKEADLIEKLSALFDQAKFLYGSEKYSVVDGEDFEDMTSQLSKYFSNLQEKELALNKTRFEEAQVQIKIILEPVRQSFEDVGKSFIDSHENEGVTSSKFSTFFNRTMDEFRSQIKENVRGTPIEDLIAEDAQLLFDSVRLSIETYRVAVQEKWISKTVSSHINLIDEELRPYYDIDRPLKPLEENETIEKIEAFLKQTTASALETLSGWEISFAQRETIKVALEQHFDEARDNLLKNFKQRNARKACCCLVS